jgi:putative membrane protein
MTHLKLTAALAAVCLASGPAFAQTARPEHRTQESATMQRHHDSHGAHEFVEHMMMDNQAEIQLGNLAQERASNADVKAFGQALVTDHTKANEELSQIASQLQVTAPTQLDKKHQELQKKLSNLQGAAFDREFIKAMIDGHEKDVRELKKKAGKQMASNTPSDRPVPDATTGSSDPERTGKATETAGTSGTHDDRNADQAVAAWAAKTLPTVEQHLQRARELQKTVSQGAR